MLTFTTQLPLNVSVYLCEFVAINELKSFLHATNRFHDTCSTSSWHVSLYQVYQINVKPRQFSPSHTCFLPVASARGSLRFSFSAWANHNKTMMSWRSTKIVTWRTAHDARGARLFTRQWSHNDEIEIFLSVCRQHFAGEAAENI